jgi:hypothetical protein
MVCLCYRLQGAEEWSEGSGWRGKSIYLVKVSQKERVVASRNFGMFYHIEESKVDVLARLVGTL